MRTFQSHSSQQQPAQRGASSSLHNPHSPGLSSGSGGPVSPLSTASITLTALLILTIPVCKSAPAELQPATTDQRQLLSQIDAVCSSYLSAELKVRASDVLAELCVLMLVQKSKELKGQEYSKRVLPCQRERPLCRTLSCVSFINSIPEEREDSQCALNSRDLGASRAEVTSSIGHEMEDDPQNMSKLKNCHLWS